MIQLQDLTGAALSTRAKEVSPVGYDQIMLTNRTLDGSMHVQTIGDPLKSISFTVLCTHTQVDAINLREAQGGRFKFVVGGKVYVGLLTEQPKWERATRYYSNPDQRFFIADLKLNITEAGVL